MSSITLRHYQGDRSGNGDFRKVHDFLVSTGRADYTFGRFDWMMTNWSYLEDEYLGRIGLWENHQQIVGVTLFDHSLDVIFPIVSEGYEFLYEEMLEYVQCHMVKTGNPDLLIFSADTDRSLIDALRKRGFIATEEKERVAMYDFRQEIPELNLPEGYHLTSLADDEDYEQYLLCLFKGFGHEEEGEVFKFDETEKERSISAYHRDFIDLKLKLLIKDASGHFVAACGMWFDQNSELALIEPVCVVPECRKLGLGREVVYEGMRRVKGLGAHKAVVGSSQQFYYSLGMIPYLSGTIWKPV